MERQTYAYKTANGVAIEADIYPAAGGRPRPAILWLHGGALIFGSRRMLARYQLERYHAAGYTVVAVDYRLAPETKLEQIITDLEDAYRWVVQAGPELFGLDGNRVGVVGHSAGGYLTLMAGVRAQPRPKALVAFYGYGDLIGPWYSRPDPHYNQEPRVGYSQAWAVVGQSDDPHPTHTPVNPRNRFYLYCRQMGRWPLEVGGHDPDRKAAWFAPYCPVQNVTSTYPPALLVHGDVDTDVPYAQSLLMADALARAGVTHELLTLPGVEHAFDSAAGAEDDPQVGAVFDRVIQFLNRQL